MIPLIGPHEQTVGHSVVRGIPYSRIMVYGRAIIEWYHNFINVLLCKILMKICVENLFSINFSRNMRYDTIPTYVNVIQYLLLRLLIVQVT
jgi:hypothetical protein